jgi:hypothetical protein
LSEALVLHYWERKKRQFTYDKQNIVDNEGPLPSIPIPSVMPHVISVLVLPKVAASSVTVKLTVKKSKASQVQAKKAT